MGDQPPPRANAPLPEQPPVACGQTLEFFSAQLRIRKLLQHVTTRPRREGNEANFPEELDQKQLSAVYGQRLERSFD